MLDFLEELENKRRYSFSDQETISLKTPESPNKLFFKNDISSSEMSNNEESSLMSEIFPKKYEIQNLKKKHIKKRKRGNKKDDFDYNKYIQQELKKSNSQNLDNSSKKKLIQKIRNRMSAQRSRLRQKQLLKTLEEENKSLKSQNKFLEQKLKKIEQENKFLSQNFEMTKRPTKNSLCTTDESDLKDTIMSSPEYFRAETDNKRFFVDKQFLFICFFVGVMLFCNSFSSEGVKIGGIGGAGYNLKKDKNVGQDFISRFYRNREKGFFDVKKRFVEEGIKRKRFLEKKKNEDLAILERFKIKNKWSFFEKKYLPEKIKIKKKVEKENKGFRNNKILLKE